MPMDLTGHIYGKWTVRQKSQRRGYWLCQCVCGFQKEVQRANLRSGRSVSCKECSNLNQSARVRSERQKRIIGILDRLGVIATDRTISILIKELYNEDKQ